jgi:hypothetical protein
VFLGETTVISAKRKRAVGIFPDRPTTASAVQALQDNGFSPRQVSIIAKNAGKQEAIAGIPLQERLTNRAGQGAAALAVTGGVLGGIAGLLMGLGMVTIPTVTPLIESNPQLASSGEAKPAFMALGGTAAGLLAGGLLGALFGLSVPYDRAKGQRDRIERGDYVLLLHSQESDFHRARTVLRRLSNRDTDLETPLLLPSQTPATQLEPLELPVEAPIVTVSAVSPQPLQASTTLQSPTLIQTKSAVASNTVASPSSSSTVAAPTAAPADLEYEASARRLPPPPPPSHMSVNRAVREPQRPSPKLEKRAIAFFSNVQMMERALTALRKANFPMHRLSLLIADSPASQRPDGYSVSNGSTVVDAASYVAPPGTLGSITGLMVGLQSVTIPGAGPFSIVGAEASTITTALNSTAVPNVTTVFTSLGLPETDAQSYGDRLMNGASLVTVKGSSDEVLQVASALNQQGIQDWSIYEIRPVPPGASRN